MIEMLQATTEELQNIAPIASSTPLTRQHEAYAPQNIAILAMRIDSGDIQIESLSHKIINLYFQYMKSMQQKENLLALHAHHGHEAKWIIGKDVYLSDAESRTFNIDRLNHYYMAIDHTLLTTMEPFTRQAFEVALATGRIARDYGQSGIKIFKSIAELKTLTTGDSRLYTTKMYKNHHGDTLILFDRFGNHEEIARIANRNSELQILELPRYDYILSTAQTKFVAAQITRIEEEYHSIASTEWVDAPHDEEGADLLGSNPVANGE